MTGNLPEVWLRGPVDGVPTQLQPVAHALLQALEEVEREVAGVTDDLLRKHAGRAATLEFHLRHITGSLDRLCTYARGEMLTDTQRTYLKAEKEDGNSTVGELTEAFRSATMSAIEQLRATPESSLDEARAVGRSGLPSSVRGLLYHAGEHTARHAGQIVTTIRALG